MFDRAVKRFSAACALVLLASAPVKAQLVNGKWQAPSKSGGAGGTAPRQGVQTPRANDATASGSAMVNNGAVPVRVIHAVVMSDGSIVADFGSGLEVVRRACPGSVSSMPLRIIGGAPSQPVPGLQPVPGMQQAPAQTTPSQLALPSAQSRTSSQAAQSSCHLRDQRGRAFVTR